MIVALSAVPVFCATCSSSEPAEYASAEGLSMLFALPPYLAASAAMNFLLPAIGRLRKDVVGELVTALAHRRRLDEKESAVVLGEHLRPAAGRLDERVAMAHGDPRGGNGQQAGVRPKDQLGLVAGDQVLVVG